MNAVLETTQAQATQDKTWLSEHFRENYAMLQAIGRLFLGGDPAQLDMIDDVIQDVFVRLWQKRDRLREHPNVDAWLVEAMRRQLKGQLSRKARRQRCAPTQSADDPQGPNLDHVAQQTYPEPSDLLEGRERYDLLVSLLGKENAAIFYAFCVLHYSARELATQYGISEGCVWTRISRSKQKILARPDLFFVMMLALLLRV